MTTNLHSIPYEQYVLSFLMDDENSWASLDVKPCLDDFYSDRHKEIFKAIENQRMLGKPFDQITMLEVLKDLGKLDSIGGEEYLVEMCSVFAAPTATGFYIEKLKKLAECRKVEEVGKKIVELAQNTMQEDMPRIAQELASGLENVLATDTRIDIANSSAEALRVLSEKIQHKTSKDGLAYGVNTGLHNLDSLLGDIEPSHFCVIAAAPGGGKTTMAQMIALNAVKRNDVPCLFVSCEMAHYELTSRIVSAVGRIPFDNIQSGKMESDDFERWVQTTAHELQKYKLDIVDKAGITINEIRGEIKRSIAKHGSIGCVIVDYIQLLNDPSSKDQFERVSNVSTGLKRIAKDFKVPVIGLSQLTKEAQGRKINMSDLRGSAQISQDADKIILLSPASNEVGVVTAEVAKNRQGMKGEARLQTRFNYCQFAAPKIEDF